MGAKSVDSLLKGVLHQSQLKLMHHYPTIRFQQFLNNCFKLISCYDQVAKRFYEVFVCKK